MPMFHRMPSIEVAARLSRQVCDIFFLLIKPLAFRQPSVTCVNRNSFLNFSPAHVSDVNKLKTDPD